MIIADPDFLFESRLDLAHDEVHLWRLDLAALAGAEEKWAELLSPDEKTRANRFRFTKDRQHFTATRAILRIILASYLRGDAKRLIFKYSDKQKPSLHPGDSEVVEFNVSHSADAALLVFARGRPVGVDIERLREDFDFEALARRFFSEQEQHDLADLTPAERCAGFFRCWTRKEAYLKARGLGLSLPLREFDMPLVPTEQPISIPCQERSQLQWTLRDVEASTDYAGAVCVGGSGWSLKD